MKSMLLRLIPLALLAACSAPDGQTRGAELEHLGEVSEALTPISNDLVVGMIQRFPRLDYVWGSSNPKVEGWPTAGQNVTWRGTLRNFSSSSRTVSYAWTWDGVSVKTGSVTIPASTSSAVGTATVDYVRPWGFDRHNLALEVDTGKVFGEIEEANNKLTVISNALGVGFYVEKSFYDYFNLHQREIVGGKSNSFDDWAQRQVTIWNELAANAVFPGTAPSGVLDRFRIDEIVIVNDSALPLNPVGIAANSPNRDDRSVDLQWGFPAAALNDPYYTSNLSASRENPFFYDGALFHELAHARYLIDNYGFNVPANPGSTNVIAIREGGAPITGTDYLPMWPGWSDHVYLNDEDGLMSGTYSRVDEYATMALNLISGRRAVAGNYNAPDNIGVYLNDLPADNEVTLKDALTQTALAGAQVQVFRSVSSTDGVWYGKSFDATPDLSFTADSAGRVRVGRNPFSNEPLNWLHGSTVMLWRVQHAGRVRYVFIDASEFNKEYWRGNTALGRYTVPVEFKVTSAGRALPLRIEAESFNRAFDTTAGNAGGACGTGDVDMETTSDPNGGTCNVGWTQPGEWLEYDVSVATAQTFDFVARVASGTTGANFHIELDGVKVGSTLTAPNAGWQGFADRTISGVNVGTGNHVIRVVFETANVNLNYLDVRAASTGTAVPARLQAEDYVRFWDSTAGNQGGACRTGDVDFQNTTDTGGGCNLGWSTAGEWIEFDVRVATPRTFNLIARVASGVTSRTFRMEVDGVQVGATQTAPSSGWQAFANRTVTTGTLSAGVHRVRIVFINGDVNLNYVDVQ